MLDLVQEESRYDRQERITWWDQAQLLNSSVLVVGAGALGNEIVKNLCLVGVGNIHVLDMDRIELSNLARCSLFRDADEGKFKAEVLAGAGMHINPDVKITFDTCTVQQFGSGKIAEFDVIIAGLDNLEARLWVNYHARRAGRTWVDGAIEGLQGLVRVFTPEGPCLECTLGESDHKNLSHRRSCALLTPDELISGKVPTNATSASIVAAFEVQETIKLLVGRQDLLAIRNQVWRFEGETMQTSLMGYFEDEYCQAHFTYPEIEQPIAFESDWVFQVLKNVGTPDSEVLAIDFEDNVIEISSCADCNPGAATVVGLQSVLPTGAGRCDVCHTELSASTFTSISPESLAKLPASGSWIWPESEIVTLRTQDRTFHVPLTRSQA